MRPRINYLALVVAAAASFVASATWYTILGNTWLTLRGIDPSGATMTPQFWEIVGQLARNLKARVGVTVLQLSDA